MTKRAERFKEFFIRAGRSIDDSCEPLYCQKCGQSRDNEWWICCPMCGTTFDDLIQKKRVRDSTIFLESAIMYALEEESVIVKAAPKPPKKAETSQRI